MKSKLGPQRIMFPLPTALVVAGNMERSNIITIAWINMLTGLPPTLGVSIGSKGYSAELIKKNKDFSVNLASVEIMREADFCGITSGEEVDKFSATGLTKIPSDKIHSPIIQECPVNIECKLVETRMTGRTHQLVGEILQTHVDEDKIRDTKRPDSIDILSINPLIYYSRAREYWALGRKVGDAYKIGYELKQRND
ncbi:MAG: flavin reductase family protein [Bacteroidales bacterium]|nr:flavin reductase family protein [Bacteroidales bacterium]MCF8398451.1 flavin reductase family protein [Bacteroidales bacterium]